MRAAESPLVDVGIPTRPETRHLAEAIQSVLAQTLTRWRLHVSINGETGGKALEIARRYADDPRVTYSVTGTTLHPGGNFTRLINMGEAPYVVLLHDDDRWQPPFLERRIEFLREHDTCGFVFSDISVIDEEGRLVGPRRLGLRAGVHRSAELLSVLYERNLVNVAAVVVRRTAYEKVGAFYREDLHFNDHEMWIRLASSVDGGYLPQADDSNYRIHPHATSAERRLRLAESSLELLDAVDREIDVPGSLRRRARARVRVRCALDAVERAEPSTALRHLAAALRLAPLACAAPRTAARVAVTLVGVALGARGRNLVGRYRRGRWARGGAETLT